MKTTSSLESWHKKFKVLFRNKHPTFDHFFECLQIEQATTKKLLLDANAGEATKDTNKKKKEAQDNVIKVAQEHYDMSSVLEHLEKLAIALMKTGF